MATFISCDPGVHECFYAGWSDAKLDFVHSLRPQYVHFPAAFSDLVIEIPQVYRGRLQKGDPNDLVDLAFSAGQFAKGFEHVKKIRPREWKKQVPKKIMMKRILDKLTIRELEVLADKATNHNFVDAVGIGLWYLGRL